MRTLPAPLPLESRRQHSVVKNTFLEVTEAEDTDDVQAQPKRYHSDSAVHDVTWPEGGRLRSSASLVETAARTEDYASVDSQGSDFQSSAQGSTRRSRAAGHDLSPCLLGRRQLGDASPCAVRAGSKVAECVIGEPSEVQHLPSSPHTYDATPDAVHEVSWEHLRGKSFGDLLASSAAGSVNGTPPMATTPPMTATPPMATLTPQTGTTPPMATTPQLAEDGQAQASEDGIAWYHESLSGSGARVMVACSTAAAAPTVHEGAKQQQQQQQLMTVFVPAVAAGQWYAIPGVPFVHPPTPEAAPSLPFSHPPSPQELGEPAPSSAAQSEQPAALEQARRPGRSRPPSEGAEEKAAARPALAPLAPGLVTAASRAANEEGGGARAVPALPISCPPEERTTVMLRNIPNDVHRDRFISILDSEGLSGMYDFIYLPVDFRTGASLGYAFVNMVSPKATQRLWKALDGFIRWNLPSKKRCSVSWSEPHQGFAANVERYRNSPVMHPSVPDACKPILFKDGTRIPYPEPTKPIRVPRVRKLC